PPGPGRRPRPDRGSAAARTGAPACPGPSGPHLLDALGEALAPPHPLRLDAAALEAVETVLGELLAEAAGVQPARPRADRSPLRNDHAGTCPRELQRNRGAGNAGPDHEHVAA